MRAILISISGDKWRNSLIDSELVPSSCSQDACEYFEKLVQIWIVIVSRNLTVFLQRNCVYQPGQNDAVERRAP